MKQRKREKKMVYAKQAWKIWARENPGRDEELVDTFSDQELLDLYHDLLIDFPNKTPKY